MARRLTTEEAQGLTNRVWRILDYQERFSGRDAREGARQFAQILTGLVDLVEAEEYIDEPAPSLFEAYRDRLCSECETEHAPPSCSCRPGDPDCPHATDLCPRQPTESYGWRNGAPIEPDDLPFE